MNPLGIQIRLVAVLFSSQAFRQTNYVTIQIQRQPKKNEHTLQIRTPTTDLLLCVVDQNYLFGLSAAVSKFSLLTEIQPNDKN